MEKGCALNVSIELNVELANSLSLGSSKSGSTF